MKNILVDIYKIRDIYTGLGQFSLNFAKEIIKYQGDRLKFDFLVPRKTTGLAGDFHTVQAGAVTRYFPFLNRNYDVWHSLHQFPSHFPNKGTKHILTVHDLNFLTEKKGAKARRYLSALQRNIDRAHTVTAISGYTRQHLLEHIDLKGRMVHVIHNGVALPDVEPRKPAFITEGEKFFFSVSVFKRAKNFEVLLPLMRHFEDFQLIIAGNNNTEYGRRMQELVRELGLQQQVILPGPVSDEEKLWLYRNCEAFLFPSLAEGFGLPVIEAMMCGRPVFLSTYTCLPEIGGDKAYYFSDFREDDMAQLISHGLKQYREGGEEAANAMIRYAERFSWKNCIERYLAIYELLCDTSLISRESR